MNQKITPTANLAEHNPKPTRTTSNPSSPSTTSKTLSSPTQPTSSGSATTATPSSTQASETTPKTLGNKQAQNEAEPSRPSCIPSKTLNAPADLKRTRWLLSQVWLRLRQGRQMEKNLGIIYPEVGITARDAERLIQRLATLEKLHQKSISLKKLHSNKNLTMGAGEL